MKRIPKYLRHCDSCIQCRMSSINIRVSEIKCQDQDRRQKLARLWRDRKQNTDLADRFRIDLIKSSFIQIKIPQITGIPKYLRYQRSNT